MAEHQGPEGGSLPSTSTITVTADDLIRSFPLPTLLITRPPNVDAMEIHTSVRTLHEVKCLFFFAKYSPNFKHVVGYFLFIYL